MMKKGVANCPHNDALCLPSHWNASCTSRISIDIATTNVGSLFSVPTPGPYATSDLCLQKGAKLGRICERRDEVVCSVGQHNT